MRVGPIRPGASGRIVLAAAATLAVIIVLAGLVLTVALRIGLSSATASLVDDVTTNIVTVARTSGMAVAVGGAAQGATTPIDVCARSTSGQTISSLADGECTWPGDAPQAIAPDQRHVSSGATGLLGWNLAGTIWQVRGLDVGGQQWTIMVRASMGEGVRLLRLTKSLLLVGGAGTWVLGVIVLRIAVQRALRPVTAIRTTVERIRAGDDLDARVPVPAGNDEIALLASTMNDMLVRLQAADAEQRRFISDAGHELRTPVAVLRTGLEVESETDRELPPGSRQAIGELASQAAGLAELVEALLTFTRLDAPQAVVAAREVDLDDLVSREVRDLRLVSSHPIGLVVEPCRLRADPTLLGQVVRNLVSNADRFARTAIRVQVMRSDAWCALIVDNDGPVLAPEDRERVFDRFVQLDAARAGSGAGLGLAICRRICEFHGGRIQATQAPDGWCRFEVALPAEDAMALARRDHDA